MEKRMMRVGFGLGLVVAGLVSVGCAGSEGGGVVDRASVCGVLDEVWGVIDALDAEADRGDSLEDLLGRNEAVREELVKLEGLENVEIGEGSVADYVEAERVWRDALDALGKGEAKAGSQGEAMEAMLTERGMLLVECEMGS